MTDNHFDIRPALPADMAAVGRLAGIMVRMHHAWDPLRFSMLSDQVETGYAHWLNQELQDADALVLVAVSRDADPKVIGYAYARLEDRDWWQLRDSCGLLHDLVVDETHRGHGVGTALLNAASAWVRERGLPRMVLHSAAANPAAQAFFRKHGFRATMVEMTREMSV